MQMTCASCRYWLSDDGREGVCQRIESDDGCLYPKPLPTGERACVQASYDVTDVWLATAAEFGCLLFDPRETNGHQSESGSV